MKVDFAVQRLSRTLKSLNQLNNACLTQVLKSTDTVSSKYQSTIDYKIFLKAPSTAPCVRYIHLESQPHKFNVHVLQSSLDRDGLLLQRIVILGGNEAALNGTFVGATSPEPNQCQIDIWANDLLHPRSAFVPLVSQSLGAVSSMSQTFVVNEDLELLTDNIILRGRFQRASVCVYGWPFDVARDQRTSLTKNFIASGYDLCLRRCAMSDSYADICLLDRDAFVSSTGLATTHEATNDELLTNKNDIAASAFHLFNSNSVRACEQETLSQFAQLVGNIPREICNSPCGHAKINTYRLPSVHALQQIAINLKSALLSYKILEAQKISSSSTESIHLFDFLNCSVWRTLMSLSLSPLLLCSTYTKFFHAYATSAEKQSFSSLSAVSDHYSIPVYDSRNATKDQLVLCLSILKCFLQNFSPANSLVISLGGFWSLAMLAKINVPEQSVGFVSQIEKFADDIFSPDMFTTAFHAIQVKALEILRVLVSTKSGVQFFLTPFGASLSETAFGTDIQGYSLSNEKCFLKRTSVIQDEKNYRNEYKSVEETAEKRTGTKGNCNNSSSVSLYDCFIMTAIQQKQFSSEICASVRLYDLIMMSENAINHIIRTLHEKRLIDETLIPIGLFPLNLSCQTHATEVDVEVQSQTVPTFIKSASMDDIKDEACGKMDENEQMKTEIQKDIEKTIFKDVSRSLENVEHSSFRKSLADSLDRLQTVFVDLMNFIWESQTAKFTREEKDIQRSDGTSTSFCRLDRDLCGPQFHDYTSSRKRHFVADQIVFFVQNSLWLERLFCCQTILKNFSMSSFILQGMNEICQLDATDSKQFTMIQETQSETLLLKRLAHVNSQLCETFLTFLLTSHQGALRVLSKLHCPLEVDSSKHCGCNDTWHHYLTSEQLEVLRRYKSSVSLIDRCFYLIPNILDEKATSLVINMKQMAEDQSVDDSTKLKNEVSGQQTHNKGSSELAPVAPEMCRPSSSHVAFLNDTPIKATELKVNASEQRNFGETISDNNLTSSICCQNQMICHNASSDEANMSIKYYASISYENLIALWTFLRDVFNRQALLTLYRDHMSLGTLLCRALCHVVKVQLREESSAASRVFKINEECNNEQYPASFQKLLDYACVLSSIRLLVDIVWLLISSPDCSKLILQSFFLEWEPCLDELCQIATECSLTFETSDNQQNQFEESLVAYSKFFPSTGWSVADLTYDAYSSLDEVNDLKTSGMLSSLVPSIFFTGLRQVMSRNPIFINRIMEIKAIHTIFTETYQKLYCQCKTTKDNISPNSESALYVISGTEASSDLFLSLPGVASGIEYLKEILKNVSEQLAFNKLMPLSESGSILNSVQRGDQAMTNFKIGGFEATLGFPIYDVSWESSETGSSSSLQQKSRPGGKYQSRPSFELDCQTTSVTQALWCGRLLLDILETSLDSRVPNNTFNQFSAFISKDQFAYHLHRNVFDDITQYFQIHQASLRSSLTKFFLHCSALTSPSFLKLYQFNAGHCCGTYASLWDNSFRNKTLPCTVILVNTFYHLLDVLLPEAPCAVQPFFKMTFSDLPLPSQGSAASGASWVPGNFVDSNLLISLLLLFNKLCQAFVIYDSHRLSALKANEVHHTSFDMKSNLDYNTKYSGIDKHESSNKNKQSTVSEIESSLITLDKMSSNVYNNSIVDTIVDILDMISRTFRLWAHRCPQSVPFLLKHILWANRLSLPDFVSFPLLLSAVNGFIAVFPANDLMLITFDNKPCSILAQELNGSEGRNLDAVIARLKQICVQNRQTESTSQPISAQKAGKLPISMTTMILSSRISLPSIVQRSLFGEAPNYNIRLHIPLAVNRCTVRNTAVATKYHNSPGKFEWFRRRLGRLTTGHDAEILSPGIFNSLAPLIHHEESHQDHPVTYTKLLNQSIAPEWASWQRLQDLLHRSIEEEVIEALVESERVPQFPLGLSLGSLLSVTGSQTLTRYFSHMLLSNSSCKPHPLTAANKVESNQTTKTETLTDYKKLLRLESISKQSQLFKVEDFAESVSVLIQSTFSSNMYVHASTAYVVAVFVWTQGPPLLDLCARVALHSLSQLPSLFTQTDLCTSSLTQDLLSISRLLLFIKHTIELFPYSSLEAAVLPLRVASESLCSLQALPSSNSEILTTPLLKALFDSLLPATIQLIELGTVRFAAFVISLLNKTSQELQTEGVHISTQSSSSTPIAKSTNPSQFRNHSLDNQMTMSLRTMKHHSTESPSGTDPWPSLTLGGVAAFINDIRDAIQGLCTVLNDLPIAWASRKDESPANSWYGLSLLTVISILKVFYKMNTHQFFRSVLLFDLPPSFLESFLLASYRSKHTPLPDDFSENCNESLSPATDSQVASEQPLNVSDDPNLFQITSDAACVFVLYPFLNKIKEKILSCVQQESDSQYIWHLLDVCDLTLACVEQMFCKSASNSAHVLLPILTSIPVTAATFPSSDASVRKKIIDDICYSATEFAQDHSEKLKDLYGDLALSSAELDRAVNEAAPNLKETLLSDLNECLISSREKVLRSSDTLLLLDRCLLRIGSIRCVICSRLTLGHYSTVQHYEDFLISKSMYNATKEFSETAAHMFKFSILEKGVKAMTPVRLLQQLVAQMHANAAWNASAKLDKIPFSTVGHTSKKQDLTETRPQFMVLPSTVLSSFTGKLSFVSENSLSSQPKIRAQKTEPSSKKTSTWQYSPSESSTDTFRQRRINTTSSRPPSKHVDEFLAEQQRQDVTSKVDEQSNAETLYDEIPQWAEFIADGVTQGLNIMEILKNPQLLMEPEIETKFRRLVDAHESIKSLFKMMELNF